MIGLLEEASELFHKAQLFEAVSEVYKIVLPIHEAHRNHSELEKIHLKLSDCYKEIISRGEHRFLGTYFRVGYYGLIFGDMDRQEFIYKEAALTRLGEFSLRLLVRNAFLAELCIILLLMSRNCTKKRLNLLI